MTRPGAHRTDAELLRASQDDPEAFGEFYDRHAAVVLAFFQRRTACAQTSLDLTAETFAEAFASRRRFRDMGAPALAWLLTIGRRKLSRSLERERVEQSALRRLGVERVQLDDGAYERLDELCANAELRGQVENAARMRVARGLSQLHEALEAR
jgi:DNA-directed RNA polymerase specialized sigma24 family protein